MVMMSEKEETRGENDTLDGSRAFEQGRGENGEKQGDGRVRMDEEERGGKGRVGVASS